MNVRQIRKKLKKLKAIAGAHNEGLLSAYSRVKRVRSKYGIGLDRYYNNYLYRQDGDSEEVLKIYKKAIEKMAAETGKDRKKIEEEYRLAYKKYRFGFVDWYEKSIYRMTLLAKLELASEPTEEELFDGFCETVSDVLGIGIKEAAAQLHAIRDAYGFSFEKIIDFCLYKFSVEEIKALLPFIPEGPAYNEVDPLSFVERVRMSAPRRPRRIEADKKRLEEIKARAKAGGKNVVSSYHDEKLMYRTHGTHWWNYYRFRLYEKTPEEYRTFIRESDKEYALLKYNASEDTEIIHNKRKFLEYFADECRRAYLSNTEEFSYERFCEFLDACGGKFIIKPIDGLQGKGVSIVTVEEADRRKEFEEILNGPKVIMEQLVVQHPQMAALGGGAVNTLRIVTVRQGEQFEILYAVLRVSKTNVVDNFHAGGVISEVDIATGQLLSHGYNETGEEFKSDPVSGKVLIGYQIPFWPEVRALVEKSARKMDNVGYIGWDVAIAEDGPLLIEGNNCAHINLIDYIGGTPETGHREMIKKYLDE